MEHQTSANLPHTQDEQSSRSSLELLYHISRELTSALELRTVLERVVFLSMRSVSAISGSFIVLDDQGIPIESIVITGDQVHDQTPQRLRVAFEKGLAGWVARNRQMALIPDTSQDERWIAQQYEQAEPNQPKSALSIPILAHGRLVGVMTLVHPQVGYFTQDKLNLLQTISDQAGIVVLNARLYQESKKQARVMTALAESAAVITASLNQEEVLQHILEQTSQALSVEAVSLGLIDQAQNDLVIRAATGWANPEREARIQLGQSIAGWVAKEGRGIIVQDVHSDPRYDPETEQRTGLGMRAIACAPLRHRGKIIGVIEALNPKAGTFDTDALLVLTGIGSLAGTAVYHAQLFERLQAAHQSYRELFDDSIDSILISDWEGKIIEANHQATLASGFDKEKLCSMRISQLHTIDEEQIGEQFNKLSSKKTYCYESRLRTRHGRELPIQVYVRQVKIEGSSHIQWILRDITERKDLDTMRDDLMSMIYHDLRSPLANVVSSLDVMDSMLPENGDDSLRSVLTIAQRSTERIQRLTNSLLDVSRLEAGQSITTLQPADPGALIREAIELVLPVIEGKKQTIQSNLPQQLPLIHVDAEMIRRVITNLLENASKYTPEESEIKVGAEVAGDWLQIWVEDNGPGIPASEQERIFDKFTRLSTRGPVKGLGLGLAYCRIAVQAHGGRIWVESELEAGARFIFTVPIAKEAGSPSAVK